MMRTLMVVALAALALAAAAPSAAAEPVDPVYKCVDNEKFVEARACVLFVPGKCLAVGFNVEDQAKGVGQCT